MVKLKKGDRVTLNHSLVEEIRNLIKLGKRHPFDEPIENPDMEIKFLSGEVATITTISFRRECNGYCGIIFDDGSTYNVSRNWLNKRKKSDDKIK